jgi:heat-inducible transcriptional repressor
MLIESEIELSERERSIFQTIVQMYILRAAPIGSRYLSKILQGDLNLSPASIRNIMADLEERELISHPHTSAGRVPTDKGYRLYVDYLMKIEGLSESERRVVNDNLLATDSPNVLKDASKILGLMSHYLGIVEIPDLNNFIVEKIELISLSSNRLLVVIALDSKNVRTVTIEAEYTIDSSDLIPLSSYVNERISGRSISFIRENFKEMMDSSSAGDLPLVRLFVDSVDRIFNYGPSEERIFIAGTPNLFKYPEIDDIEKVRSVIEIIENEDIIIHLLDKRDNEDKGFRVYIGQELGNESLKDYSLLVSCYNIGSAEGSIGLIGPKRMNYSKMASLVNYVAHTLSKTK